MVFGLVDVQGNIVLEASDTTAILGFGTRILVILVARQLCLQGGGYSSGVDASSCLRPNPWSNSP